MTEKTIPEIVDFMLDPDAHELNARIEDRFLSLVKVTVGTATFVYGNYGFSSDFMANLSSKYLLGSIVADNKVYVVNTFQTFGKYVKSVDDLPNTQHFADYVIDVNERAAEIARNWYADLPQPDSSDWDKEPMSTQSIIAARSDFVMNGRASSTFMEKPAEPDCISDEVAIRLLIGSISLEDYMHDLLESTKDEDIRTKTNRAKMLELVRRGGDLSEAAQAVADAIRDIDAKTLNVTFEHDGKVREYKLGKFGLQKCLMENYIYPYYDTFRTQRDGEELSIAFTGKRYGHILVSYISRITSRGKTVYVRKDEA